MMPSAGAHGTALVHHPTGVSHIEDPDHGYERPPPKGAVELFDPKAARRTASTGKGSPRPDRPEKEKERPRMDGGVAGPLVVKVAALSLEDQQGANAGSAQSFPKETPSTGVLLPA
jgi:hypothetical protein